MSKKFRKKKSLLINPRFQWTLIGFAAGVTGIILLSMFGLLNHAFLYFRDIGQLASLPKDHVYFEFIQMQEGTVMRTLLGISLVVSLVLIFGGLYVSHKIAGPLYRMKKDLEKMAKDPSGGLQEIHFRKGDYFPELAQAFNQVVQAQEALAKKCPAE